MFTLSNQPNFIKLVYVNLATQLVKKIGSLVQLLENCIAPLIPLAKTLLESPLFTMVDLNSMGVVYNTNTQRSSLNIRLSISNIWQRFSFRLHNNTVHAVWISHAIFWLRIKTYIFIQIKEKIQFRQVDFSLLKTCFKDLVTFLKVFTL